MDNYGRKFKNRGITDQQRADIIRMYKDDVLIKCIVIDVGVNHCTVNAVARAAGLPIRGVGFQSKKVHSQAVKDNVMKLIGDGVSIRQTEKKTGVPYSTIRAWKNKAATI